MTQVTSIKTPRARLSFANLFKARVSDLSQDKTPKYGCTLIFDKTAQASPAFAAMKDAAAQAAREKWGGKLPPKLRSPFGDGNEKDLEKYPEFTDAVFVNVTSKQRPGLVAGYIDPATGKLKVIEDETEIYSGCYVVGSLTLYTYAQSGNSGVAFGLRNLQMVAEGEPLGGRVRAEDDFAPVEGAADPNAIFG